MRKNQKFLETFRKAETTCFPVVVQMYRCITNLRKNAPWRIQRNLAAPQRLSPKTLGTRVAIENWKGLKV